MSKEDRKLTSFLVVDGISSLRKALKGILLQRGYQNVAEPETAEDAWEKLQETEIDFIICEWSLPKMSGYDLMKQVRTQLKMLSMPSHRRAHTVELLLVTVTLVMMTLLLMLMMMMI